MPIPTYESCMLPLLKLLDERSEVSARDAYPALADRLELTSDERKQLLPSGRQEVFKSRVGWARTYLKKAGLIETPRRGLWTITPRGKEAANNPPPELNVAFLMQFPEFREWYENDEQEGASSSATLTDKTTTPEEQLEIAHGVLLASLKSDLLQQVKNCSPHFFETLVVELLVKMGYGGNLKDAGAAIGRVGDEGIDGIINEDVLGLDVVYIQAKKWDGAKIGRPEIQKFAGALQGRRAKKGVFITTSEFSEEAKAFVKHIDSRIVLIDGRELARLMIERGLGVTLKSAYEVKQVDLDYFTEE